MGEPIFTRCPTCGLRVRADPARGSIACEVCGQVFTISHDPEAAPDAPAQKIPRWGLILLTAVVPIVISILALWAAFGR